MQTIARRTLGLVLAVLLVGGALTAPATAEPPDQCAMPVSERTEAWTCFEADAAAPAARTDEATAAASRWCRPIGAVPGCWQVGSNRARAQFHSNNIAFGWGSTTVGRVSLDYYWTLSGPSIIAKPVQVRNTAPTISTTFKGYIMNGARDVVGSVKNRCNDRDYGPTGAGALRQWTGGCTIYDNDSWDHESVIETQWRMVGYPGYWFIYIKSPVAHSNDKEIYLFTDHEDLPGMPWGAGHAG
jgi:hypothetical protein